ncbi:hypothetical protein MSPP1_002747 [Malassezia sp. CBS 17886]|nr:hypothetical protein MSPP1_002747 [Malassezia sp. CBS 17886]
MADGQSRRVEGGDTETVDLGSAVGATTPLVPADLTPDVLVDECVHQRIRLTRRFKRQGHFDHMRKHLFQQFQHSAHQQALLEQIESHLKQHVRAEADRLAYRDARLRHSELMHEADRLPVLDKLVDAMSAGDAGSAAPGDAELVGSRDAGTVGSRDAETVGPGLSPMGALLGQHGSIAAQVTKQITQMTRAHCTTARDDGGSVHMAHERTTAEEAEAA